ncbi:riboflavin biosynthesis protein [Jeongeupia chitinilytica]|uniref:Riboflavin biosynthesis protein n=2 Tax=Jeongeupia chitinilytica TaxID=1041641 RepID=A0ABQ3H1U1_9NEIS|nr:riboflavin biosynthesis protein [Jeongeupia chitinilytica]
MLAQVRNIAHERGLATAVLTFEPHPRELFTPDSAPARLSSFREKAERLAAEGIDYLIVQRFDRRFAGYEADAFRDEIIAGRLNARHVIVGDDFCFGARRAGDISLLAQTQAFDVQALPTVVHAGGRVSSTAVRAALAQGDMAQAATLLGRPYSISGRVIGGDRLGRQLGFPTANIQLHHNKPPMMGVFVVEVHGLEKPWQGVASLGVRPTVKGADAAPVLEVHLFDFNRQIYGEHLRVDFLAKLRDEEKYSGLEPLIAQIHKDCDQARDWFANRDRH